MSSFKWGSWLWTSKKGKKRRHLLSQIPKPNRTEVVCICTSRKTAHPSAVLLLLTRILTGWIRNWLLKKKFYKIAPSASGYFREKENCSDVLLPHEKLCQADNCELSAFFLNSEKAFKRGCYNCLTWAKKIILVSILLLILLLLLNYLKRHSLRPMSWFGEVCWSSKLSFLRVSSEYLRKGPQVVPEEV